MYNKLRHDTQWDTCKFNKVEENNNYIFKLHTPKWRCERNECVSYVCRRFNVHLHSCVSVQQRFSLSVIHQKPKRIDMKMMCSVLNWTHHIFWVNKTFSLLPLRWSTCFSFLSYVMPYYTHRAYTILRAMLCYCYKWTNPCFFVYLQKKFSRCKFEQSSSSKA